MKKKYSVFINALIGLINAFLITAVLSSCKTDIPETTEAAYTVTISNAFENYIQADKDSAKQGETVTLTAQKFEGKKIYSISVKTSADTIVSCTALSENIYTFTMPNDNVIVSGILKLVEENNSGNCAVTRYPEFYLLNSDFSLEGVEVSIYDDLYNVIAVLDYTNTIFTYETPDMSKEGSQTVELSFTYNGKSYSTSYIVYICKQNYSFVIEHYPRQMCYLIGEDVSLDGLEVVVYEDDGTTKAMSPNGWWWTTVTVDTTSRGTKVCKVDFYHYYDNSKYTVYFQIKVFAPEDVYVIEYTDAEDIFDEEMVKDNFVRISLARSVTKIDVLKYYALKKKVLSVKPARILYDEIPLSLPYYFDIPDEPRDVPYISEDLNGYIWKGEKKTQWDLIIDFFRDFARFNNLTETCELLDNEGILSINRLKYEMRALYPDSVQYDSDGAGFISLEYIPGINFVYAEANKSGAPILSVQVDSNITLFVSGTMNIYFDWNPYYYTPNHRIEDDVHYFEGVMPIFWLKEGASVKVDDWSKVTFVAYNNGLYMADYIHYWTLQYALQLFNFFDINFTSAEELPVMEFGGGIGIDFTGYTVENDSYIYNYTTGLYSGMYGEVDASCVTSFKGGYDYICLNKTIIGDLVQIYSKHYALDKLKCKYINNGGVSGRQTDNDPTLYIGNEVNVNCPKMPVREWLWWLKSGVDVENMCITDDGSNIKASGLFEDLEENVTYGRMANLRFEVDLTDVNFDNYDLNGIIDFAGDAPSFTKDTFWDPAKVIVRKLTHELFSAGFSSVDITELSQTETTMITMSNGTQGTSIRELITDDENKKLRSYISETHIGLENAYRTREEDERFYISNYLIPDFDIPAIFVFNGEHIEETVNYSPNSIKIADRQKFLNKSMNKIIIKATVIDYGRWVNSIHRTFLAVYPRESDSTKQECIVFDYGNIETPPQEKNFSLIVTDSETINDIKENGLWMHGLVDLGCRISVSIE